MRLRALAAPHDVAGGRAVLADLVLALMRVGACLDRWRVEHVDVADVGRAEVIADPVDEDPLVDVKRGQHRAAGNLVRLDDERLDQEGQSQGYGDDPDQFGRRASQRLLGLSHTYSASVAGSSWPPGPAAGDGSGTPASRRSGAASGPARA